MYMVPVQNSWGLLNITLGINKNIIGIGKNGGVMGYEWEYIGMKYNNGEYIFHGKTIGVVSESHSDFFETITHFYPGGKIHKGSHYFVNGHMFHIITHTNDLKEEFDDIIQTSISILNPFYDDIYRKINNGNYRWG